MGEHPEPQPFVGVRGFRLTRDLVLASVIMPTFWATPEVGPATCYARPTTGEVGKWQAARDPAVPEHDAPYEGCRCGFGAYHPGALGKAVPHVESATVAGVVVGYGTVLPGTKGWRASHARLVALILPDLVGGMLPLPTTSHAPADVIREVADQYGVPTMRCAQVPRLAPEFGQVLPWLPDDPVRLWR